MTKEQQRIAIAEACGYKQYHEKGGQHEPWEGWSPEGKFVLLQDLPNYPTDPAAALTFCDWLAERGYNIDIHRRHDWVVTLWGFQEETGKPIEVRAPSLPLAICESGLRAVGLWTEQPTGRAEG